MGRRIPVPFVIDGNQQGQKVVMPFSLEGLIDSLLKLVGQASYLGRGIGFFHLLRAPGGVATIVVDDVAVEVGKVSRSYFVLDDQPAYV
jgi:hypothetical protein